MHHERKTQTSPKYHGPDVYRLNKAVAWCSFFMGAATGMVMGLWAFDGPGSPPAGMTSYADTSRRLLRLGHIAFFGIGYLNLLLAAELPSLRLSDRQKVSAAQAMNVANILLPVTLMAAAYLPAIKYLLPIPATAATGALAIAAWGAVRRLYPIAPPHRSAVRHSS